MRACGVALALFALVVLASAGAGQDRAKQKLDAEQREHLQGTWVATSVAGFGADVNEEQLRNLKLVIKGDHLTAHYGDKTVEATFRVDASHSPRQIDVTLVSGPPEIKGAKVEGIYLIEGQSLRMAFRDPGQPRPEFFAKPNQTEVHGFTFRKEKPAKR
jgi:uncharacterized protein (TIGR03067 family)